MAKNATDGKIDELVAQLAELASERGAHIAVAESLTGGQLSTALAAGPHSGDWYRGAVVCYCADVKFEVLGVPRGPVINARTARAMAAGVKNLLRADVAVGITGVGGAGAGGGSPCGNGLPERHLWQRRATHNRTRLRRRSRRSAHRCDRCRLARSHRRAGTRSRLRIDASPSRPQS